MVGRWTRRRPLRRRDFLEAQRSGRRVSSRYFLILVRKRGEDAFPRLGVTVTRKVAGAVRRNRIKRLIREWFRRNGRGIGPCDVVVIAKRGIPADLKLEGVEADLNRALANGGYGLPPRSSEGSGSTRNSSPLSSGQAADSTRAARSTRPK
jgi:ribonuclease P protein component